MDSADLGGPEPKGMDADERREMVVDRRQMLKRAGLGAAALTVPAAIMATPSMGAVTDALAADSFIKSHPKWKFNFVNHVTTNPFFVPTIYGAQDACSLLGTSYQWTGSQTSDISQMVNAMNAAITAKADGISVCLVSLTAFNGPTNRALGKGIPVLSYNADAPNKRLAYIGQDLYLSGYNMGQRIVDLVGSGDVALFIATPGQLNIQPRIDGAIAAIKKFGKGKIKTTTTATGALLPDELAKIEAYYLGHKNLKGMFAVDYGSTQGIGQVMQKYGLAKKGDQGRRLRPGAARPQGGQSGPPGLHDRPAALPAGLAPRPPALLLQVLVRARCTVRHEHRNPFVTKSNVNPYLTTKTRYEGSSSKQKYPVTQKG